MRQDFAGLREEFRGLRGEVTGLHGELTDLRTEVRESAVETRRHFDVTAEALRHEVQIVAEGVVTANVAIERLGTELRAEMNSRFAVVDAAFIQVRRDFEDLRARL